MGTKRHDPRALVVGRCDEETIAWCGVLQLWGFDALATAGIERALCAAAELAPAAVIIDLAIPGCDPLDLVCALRAHELTRDVAIIAIADVVTADVGQLATARGCDVVLSRPVDLDELAAEVEGCTGSRALRTRKRSQRRAA